MKKNILFLFIFFIGCAYNSGVIQKAEKSYLQFSGNIADVSIVIDDNESFTLHENDALYELSNGKHRLKAYRNNEMIVNRIIFLEDQATMEISLP